MKIYKVPVTFEVFLRERQLADLDNEVKKSLKTVIELDGVREALDLAEIGEPRELSSKEDREFITAATDAYKTQLMLIANGLITDPKMSAKQAQETIERMF